VFRVVIPARHASTRLSGKPLALLAGEPMILHVLRIARRSGAAEVIVATDDERIRSACAAAGAVVEMTSTAHASGTDRIAEIAARRGWLGEEIVVNVQGDEPMLPHSLIAQVAGLLAANPAAAIATLATPMASDADYLDPNVVKVVRAPTGGALFQSCADSLGSRWLLPVPRAGSATGRAAPHRPLRLPRFCIARLPRHRRRRLTPRAPRAIARVVDRPFDRRCGCGRGAGARRRHAETSRGLTHSCAMD
jgi:CTP:molybdopterin cytidylyltransferase MocA